MVIINATDYTDMSRKAANLVAAQIVIKPACVLGLATGSSPEGMYAQLVARHQAGDLDFSHVTTVNLDEYRGLAPSHEQSYRYFMDHHLFHHVNIDPARTFLPNGLAADPAECCRAYDALLATLGPIDLQVLGIGGNGHIGFNEPGTAFEPKTHCVDLADTTIEANQRFFERREDVPRQAYTMGIQPILQARKIVLLASGSGKAQALRDALYDKVTPAVPASVLQLHSDVTVIADTAARALL